MSRLTSRTLRLALLVATATAAFAAPAAAHITVNPREATKGGFTKVTFRVPNERDNAGTTKVEIAFPADHPVASVGVRPQPGWNYEVTRGAPAKPLSAHGDAVTEVVTRITWTGGPIRAGEFAEFDVSLGPLPADADQLEFKALQTYDNGEVVRWIESPVDGAEEPEHPAPVLKLLAEQDETDPGTETAAGATTPGDDDDDDADSARSMSAIALGVGAVALLLSIGALVRGRARS